MTGKKSAFIGLVMTCLIALPAIARADFESDVDALLDWAEITFPHLFAPSPRPTETFDIWRYRYYPQTNTFAGVDDQGDVYVRGGVFGEFKMFIDTLSNLLAANPAILGNNNMACATVPLPDDGSRVVFSVNGVSGGQPVTGNIDVTYISATPTRAQTSTLSTTSSAGVTTTSNTNTDQMYSILDDFIYIESIAVTGTASTLGFNTPINTLTTFNPNRLVGPANEMCEGDTWFSPSVSSSTNANGRIFSGPTGDENGQVVAVNQSLTVPAGTFSAVRIRTDHEDGSSVESWTSIQNGLLLRNEVYDTNGNLELTEVATTVQ